MHGEIAIRYKQTHAGEPAQRATHDAADDAADRRPFWSLCVFLMGKDFGPWFS